MLKRPITYEDADGKTITDTFWFNITRVEFTRWIANQPNLDEKLDQAVKSENTQVMFNVFEELILMSYGVRTEDGKGFTKNPELLQSFKDSFAYNQLFIELSDMEGALDLFFKGILPKGIEIDLSPKNLETTLTQLKEVQDISTVSIPSTTNIPIPPEVPKKE
jgi:hypothetical protein